METPEYPYFILLIDFFSWRIIALQCGGGLCCTSTQKKLGIKLPQDPAIPLPRTSPEKITVLKDACIPRVTAALLLYF